ncbi:MAG: amino acid permease [Actinomycetes bacterium]
MSDRSASGSRGINAYGLFAVVYATSAAAIYFALGIVAGRSLGLTPLVFAVGGLFLGLAAMTYTEGATGHPEPGGSSMLARHAFNEMVSFAAGWAVVLDFVVVIALSAVTAANYLGTLWSPLGEGALAALVAGGVIAYGAQSTVRGAGAGPARSRAVVAVFDIGVQLLLVVLGLALVFEPSLILDPIDFGRSPKWSDVIYALTLVTVGFTGIEAAASLAPEARLRKGATNRLLVGGVATIVVLQAGVALVGLSALPVEGGQTELGGKWIEAPLVGVASAIDPGGIGDWLDKVVAISGFVALAVAVNSAMFGVSRLAYSLVRNRQIPRVVGRLSLRWGTPWMIIVLVSVAAFGLALPADIKLLAALYAFGAMLAITIAHASVVRLRLRGDSNEGAWKMPLSLRLGGAEIPVPAAVGALVSAAALVTVVLMHGPAAMFGLSWLFGGLILYAAYRRLTGNSLLRRVEVSERALVYEPESASYGSILVPVLGGPLDDDIVQTAGRLAGSEQDSLDEEGAAVEAIWFHQIPMSLPLDGPLPPGRGDLARERLLRAKAVGEEYQGVTVSTAQVRVRKIGEGIVREAKRRGVDVIVLSAEEPSGSRAGSVLHVAPGGSSIGEITRYVLRKAQCRVVLTIPATVDSPAAPSAE